MGNFRGSFITRFEGTLIMFTSDDNGLVLPPKLAPLPSGNSAYL